jgi:hypothetical protein
MFRYNMSFSCLNRTLVFCREMSNNNHEGSGISNNLPPDLQSLSRAVAGCKGIYDMEGLSRALSQLYTTTQCW